MNREETREHDASAKEAAAKELRPRQRVLAALRGEPVRPLPVGGVTQTATVSQMRKLDAWWPEAHFKADLLARLAGGARTLLGFDVVRVPFDQTVEAELLGAKIDIGDRSANCAIASHPLVIHEPPPALPDFNTGRGKVVLHAITQLRKELGDDAAVVGGVVGPFTLAGHLVGMSEILMESLLQPAKVRPLLEFAARLAAEYARLQLEAGADAVCIDDMAGSLDLTSPELYENVILGAQQNLIEAIDGPVILHMCGGNTKILDLLAKTRATALSLEDKTDLGAAVRKNAGCVIGGVPTIAVLLGGTPEDVHRATQESLAAGVGILAPGCGIPPRSPTENVLEMARVAREGLPPA